MSLFSLRLYIRRGPAVALLVEKLDVFEEIPRIVGNENPSMAGLENPERFEL